MLKANKIAINEINCCMWEKENFRNSLFNPYAKLYYQSTRKGSLCYCESCRRNEQLCTWLHWMQQHISINAYGFFSKLLLETSLMRGLSSCFPLLLAGKKARSFFSYSEYRSQWITFLTYDKHIKLIPILVLLILYFTCSSIISIIQV